MIAGVVLAAGQSRRLGRPKQLIPLAGRTLLVHAVECCVGGGCAPVVVVLGASREIIAPTLKGLPVEVVVNAAWREGIASSIRAGLASLVPEAAAVVLATCDQPRLTPEVVRRLIASFDGAPRSMAACEYAGTIGVPALFGRGHFERLSRLRGDRGAGGLLRENRESVVRLPWPEGAFDVDRPSDCEEV